MLTFQARAKINLALHVTGQRADGYHLIDSLVGFTDFGDALSARQASSTRLLISGPFSEGLENDGSNLILKAAELLRTTRGKTAGAAGIHGLEAEIHLTKNLPLASGIGGGSADAAAALHLLNRLWGLGVPLTALMNLGVELGADVPMCLQGVPARATGVGERLMQLPMPAFPIVLINPGVEVSTPAVFNRLERRDNAPLSAPPASQDLHDWFDYLSAQRNDLQLPAETLAPQIADCIGRLAATDGIGLSRMSGSGATCFGLYETMEQARQASREIKGACPEWWVQATITSASNPT